MGLILAGIAAIVSAVTGLIVAVKPAPKPDCQPKGKK